MAEEQHSTVYSSPGVKLDEGKDRFELIPPEPLFALAKLYTDGATKYGDRNWEKGMSYMRLFGALCRHAFKWARGESWDVDPKTGAITHHMIQVMWCAAGIYALSARPSTQSYDDRPFVFAPPPGAPEEIV